MSRFIATTLTLLSTLLLAPVAARHVAVLAKQSKLGPPS